MFNPFSNLILIVFKLLIIFYFSFTIQGNSSDRNFISNNPKLYSQTHDFHDLKIHGSQLHNAQLHDSQIHDPQIHDSHLNKSYYQEIFRNRQRKREQRLLFIKSQILFRLGMNAKISPKLVNVSTNPLSERDKEMISQIFNKSHVNRISGINDVARSEIFSEKLRSLYSSCSTPHQTDASLWFNNTDARMKLYYHLPFSKSNNLKTETNLLSAKLRLYKRSVSVPDRDGELSNFSLAEASDDDDEDIWRDSMTLTLFQYLKPLKATRREKKRRIGSKRVKMTTEEWIYFDVSNCVNYWKTHVNKNYGLEIEIEDSFGTRLNPDDILISMNCSDTSSSPFPNLSNVLPAEAFNKIPNESVFFTERYPTLDLLTVEVAKSETPKSLIQ